jgi:hypothetical protein
VEISEEKRKLKEFLDDLKKANFIEKSSMALELQINLPKL